MAGVIVLLLAACKPEPPPDIIRPQREALDKAKALEGQMQKDADQQRRTIDDASK